MLQISLSAHNESNQHITPTDNPSDSHHRPRLPLPTVKMPTFFLTDDQFLAVLALLSLGSVSLCFFLAMVAFTL